MSAGLKFFYVTQHVNTKLLLIALHICTQYVLNKVIYTYRVGEASLISMRSSNAGIGLLEISIQYHNRCQVSPYPWDHSVPA